MTKAGAGEQTLGQANEKCNKNAQNLRDSDQH
jgi:hypothetical protein